MSRAPKLLPLLTIMILAVSVVAAQALTWTFPTYPFYASTTEHGAMYFQQGMTATNGSWIGGLLAFTDWNYAAGGAFNHTVGFAAQNDTTMTFLEAIATDHILIQTNRVGALANVTLWLQGCNVVNVTNAVAYTWDNSTYLLEITAPMGLANINIALVPGGGSMPTIFFIPQWFVDQGGAFFGVANFFSQLMAVMTAFVAWFLLSVSAIVSLIWAIMTIVLFVGGAVIYWFTAFVTFWVQLFTVIGGLFDGTTGPIDIITSFNVAAWLNIVPIISTMMWYDSIINRMRKSGTPTIDILVGDIQRIMYIVGVVWEWTWLIFNFVYGVVMQFVSLLWGLIP